MTWLRKLKLCLFKNCTDDISTWKCHFQEKVVSSKWILHSNSLITREIYSTSYQTVKHAISYKQEVFQNDIWFYHLLVKRHLYIKRYRVTAWKFHDFSVIQILREINFGESWGSKSAVFAILGALKSVNLLNFSLLKVQKLLKIWIQSLYML